VIYVLTNQWYVQPYLGAFITIQSDGSWQSFTYPWQAIVVLLVNQSTYTPAATSITNPALDPGVLAFTNYPSTPVSLNFSGRTWGIKTTGNVASDQFDPGPNYWSSDPAVVNVAVDGLHLKTMPINGHWQSAEVYLLESLGYGTYTVKVNSRLDQLDKYTVAAPLFIYADLSHELDNEYSGLGGLIPGNTAQFVSQPYTVPGNLDRYNQSTATQFTTQMVWRADNVTFRSWNGWSDTPAPSDIIHEWTYTGSNIPQPGPERVHINLWLFGGQAPLNGVGDELVIGSFTFQPSQTCTYQLSAASASAPSGASTGTSIGVTAPVGCLWIAASGPNSNFLTVTTGASGNGNGSVGYTVAANAGLSRVGTITIAGQTYTVTQDSGLLELDTAPITGSPGVVAHIPLNLSLTTGTTVNTLVFTLTVTPSGASPAPALTTQMTYAAANGQPAPTNTSSGALNTVTVTYTSIGTPFSGTVNIGSMLVTIPASGQQNQKYSIVLSAVGAMSSGNTVNVNAGQNNTLTVASLYNVGDIWPFTANNAGFFGDTPTSAINLLDLLEELRLVAGTEVIPACSDRYDAADTWPLDTQNTRGGDATLNLLDLLEELRRSANTDTSRPTRPSRGLSCPATAPQVVKLPPVHPSAAEAVLEFGEPKPTADGNWQTPVYVQANVDLSLVGLVFSVEYALGDDEPQLKFIAADGFAPDLKDDSVRGKIAAAWLQDWTANAGDKVLFGYIETVSQPTSMSFLRASANAKVDGRDIKLFLGKLKRKK
jgi:hypothetical protein